MMEGDRENSINAKKKLAAYAFVQFVVIKIFFHLFDRDSAVTV